MDPARMTAPVPPTAAAPDAPTGDSPALVADLAEARKATGFGSVTVGEKSFPIVKRPNMLLLAELGNIESGSPDAMGALAGVLKQALGPNYQEFKSHVIETDVDEEGLMDALREVIEATIGRPTK